MIKKLTDHMEFKVVPVDEDNLERGNKVVGRVELRAECPIMGDGEEVKYLKLFLTKVILAFLYEELEADLNKLRRALRSIQSCCPDDSIGLTKAAVDIVIGLQRKIKEI